MVLDNNNISNYYHVVGNDEDREKEEHFLYQNGN